MQRALSVLLGLLKPCFFGSWYSSSLYKHHQAVLPFPGQNKHRERERERERARERDKQKWRKKEREKSVITPLSYELSGILVIKHEWWGIVTFKVRYLCLGWSVILPNLKGGECNYPKLKIWKCNYPFELWVKWHFGN